jgi:S-adenosyl-l-methionine hydroxide adenosyltransferase
MLLTVIADYGVGDLAFAEVRQRFALLLPDADLAAVPVPPFDTVGAGFCAAQLALNEGPSDRVVYINVAPRQDEDEPRADNAGERLIATRLDSGVLVVGVAAGSSFSFLAGEGAVLRAVDVAAEGSQFRSRDVFPAAVAALVRGQGENVGDEVSAPAPPERSVLYVDGYGNVKTSWYDAPAPVGTRVQVRIEDVRREAVVSDGVFAVPPGTMSFAPGSSGWPRRGGGRRTCYELFDRGGNAYELFGEPSSGTPVEVLVAF